MKLTPWFDGSVKPRRKGVYQQMCGGRWPCCGGDPWRGLAQQPKGKK